MDTISKEKRSKIMSNIHGTETSLEVAVRKYLFSCGFRYRKNVKALPGKPDIVLQRYRTVIFVNGCFWHHHTNCKIATIPKSNTDYWVNKFNRNTKNDIRHSKELRKMGYHVITIWECKLNNNFDKEMKRVIRLISKHDI